MKESTCPYCDQLLVKGDKVVESCCSKTKPDMANKSGMNVCLNCGLVNGYEYGIEFLDFYENMYKIRRKSVYNRKYHIENVLNSICLEHRVNLTNNQSDRIYRVFAEIDDIIPKLNQNRKRLISTKYIIKQIFMLMGIPFFINVSKSKRPLQFYNRYWAKILLLKFDKIMQIIH